jgi:hypothetical protein
MKKKLLLMACLVTVIGTNQATPAEIGKLIEAVDRSNPEKMRELLANAVLTHEQKDQLLTMAHTQRQIAQNRLDLKRVNFKDALRVSGATVATFCTALFATTGAIFGIVALFEDEVSYKISAATFAAAGLAGYLAQRQFYKGLTKDQRKTALVNALAVEDLVQTAHVA